MMKKDLLLESVLLKCAPFHMRHELDDLSGELSASGRQRYQELAAQVSERLDQLTKGVGNNAVYLCHVAEGGVIGKAAAHLVRDETGHGVKIMLNQPNAVLAAFEEDPGVAEELGTIWLNGHADTALLTGQHLAELHLAHYVLGSLAEAA